MNGKNSYLEENNSILNTCSIQQLVPPCVNNEGRTILELNCAPVTNIIVQQFELCNHEQREVHNIKTIPQPVESVNNGKVYHFSNFYNQNAGYDHVSLLPQTCRNISETFNNVHYPAIASNNTYDSNITEIKQEPLESFSSQDIAVSIDDNFTQASLDIGFGHTTTSFPNSSYPMQCHSKVRPTENYELDFEIQQPHDLRLNICDSKKLLLTDNKQQGFTLPDHNKHDHYLSSRGFEKPEKSSDRKISRIVHRRYSRKSRSLSPFKLKRPRARLMHKESVSPNSRSPNSICKRNKSRNSVLSCKRKGSLSPKSGCSLLSPERKNRHSLSPKKRSCSPLILKLNKHNNTSSTLSQSSKNSSLKTRCRKLNNEDDHMFAKSRNSSKDSLMERVESLDLEEELDKEKRVWTRTSPADLYYKAQQINAHLVNGTENLTALCCDFEEHLLKRAENIRAQLPKYEPLPRKKRVSLKKHGGCHSCNSSSSNSSSDSESEDNENCVTEEFEHKKKHPLRLHQELWFNDCGEMNDGPLCRCSARARRSGIRHNIYAGEKHLNMCDPNSNNADKLFHYRITISPPTNFLVKTPTIIEYDAHEYIFEGFSMFSHKKLDALPLCKVIRFNIEYTIVYFEERFPQNFTVEELNHFGSYLFQELLELVDLDLRAHGDSRGCAQYHFMPRFVRELPGNGKEILSMSEVLKYLLHSSCPLVSSDNLADVLTMPQSEWQRFTEHIKGMIVTYPGKKPCSLRVDQLDRDQEKTTEPLFPEIVHFGIRPPQLSYAGNPDYQKAWREYVKFRHLLANMPKPSFEDKRKLVAKEIRLQNMRTKIELKRNVTVTVSSEHFYKTGIMCDVVQHAMLIPVLVSHLRFHRSLDVLEEKIRYKFQNRFLLQLALTHPSYRENFGTNPDHARNSLTNCGIRQPVYGDRRIHYMNTRKRGINTLINIMSRFGKLEVTESNITHNERLEFLGDAVVEFVTSVHLFHMFPDLEEGGLATYRAAIVQNQHLAVLAKTLGLEEYMLYAHGSDLCHDLELRHAMANCFEALMGALFLDGGIQVADKVFGEALFKGEDHLLNEWVNYPPHPLQEQEPLGDRKWISCFPLLQKLIKFESSIGVQFNHIRLLARAFTDRSIGYTNLTLGSNQRLEFLGDTVLQLIASEYLYKYFPEHHEGHLSLLRSSLVNNRTQAVVCNDLGMTDFALYSNPKAELKTKDRADLLEAFLGALYVDKGLEYCQVFCSVCFFPRLQDFIMHQDWNDPKSKLQQCCLTLRTMEGGEPEIPVYKVIECMGPTNTRIYTVAVYFKGSRLAKASGHSIQQAEMNAAKKALNNSEGLFPQLDHQKRVISKSMSRQNQDGSTRSSSPKSSKADKKERKYHKKESHYKKGSKTQHKYERRSSPITKTQNSFKISTKPLSKNPQPTTLPLAYRSKTTPESLKVLTTKKNNTEDGIKQLVKESSTNHEAESNSKSVSSSRDKNVIINISSDGCVKNLEVTSQTSKLCLNNSQINAHDHSEVNKSVREGYQSLANTLVSTPSLCPSVTRLLNDKKSNRPSTVPDEEILRKRGRQSRSRSMEISKSRSSSPYHIDGKINSYEKIRDKSRSIFMKNKYRSRSKSLEKENRSRSTSCEKKFGKSKLVEKCKSNFISDYQQSSSTKKYRYSPSAFSRSRSRSVSRKNERRNRSRSPSRNKDHHKSYVYKQNKSLSHFYYRRSRSRSFSPKSPCRSPLRHSSLHRKRSVSRSSSRERVKRKRSRSREEARQKLMDYMLGKRSSPGRENKSHCNTSDLLVDLMFNKQTPPQLPSHNRDVNRGKSTNFPCSSNDLALSGNTVPPKPNAYQSFNEQSIYYNGTLSSDPMQNGHSEQFLNNISNYNNSDSLNSRHQESNLIMLIGTHLDFTANKSKS